MTRRSLIAKSTPLGVVQLLTTLGEGPAQGVHIVLVVDVLAAPFQTGAILLPRLFPTPRALPSASSVYGLKAGYFPACLFRILLYHVVS